jgi:hypothetical protein
VEFGISGVLGESSFIGGPPLDDVAGIGLPIVAPFLAVMFPVIIWAKPRVVSIERVVTVFGVVALGTFAAVAQRKASVVRFVYTYSASVIVAWVLVTSVGRGVGRGVRGRSSGSTGKSDH